MFLGLIVTCCVAVWLAMTVDVTAGGSISATRGDWTVTSQWATGSLRVTSEREKPSWCPSQAAGAPDTPGAGDYPTAWAPATSNGSPEWLEVEYDQARVPVFVEVHETYSPGAMTRVTLIDEGGREIEAWEGADPTSAAAGSGVSRIKVSVPGGKTPAVKKVRVYVGRAEIRGWNEIDAVGLVDAQGTTHWATDATASSWYGEGSYPRSGGTPLKPGELIPSWSGLRTRNDAWVAPSAVEARAVEARGWPMLALWAPGTATTGSSGFRSRQQAIFMSGFVTMGPTPGVGPKVMPYRPIVLGLVVDSAVYGAVLGLLWVLLVWPRRFFVEVSRVKRGCCVRCGYDLGYELARGCPECGWRREAR